MNTAVRITEKNLEHKTPHLNPMPPGLKTWSNPKNGGDVIIMPIKEERGHNMSVVAIEEKIMNYNNSDVLKKSALKLVPLSHRKTKQANSNGLYKNHERWVTVSRNRYDKILVRNPRWSDPVYTWNADAFFGSDYVALFEFVRI
jgi:hypothetical protein